MNTVLRLVVLVLIATGLSAQAPTPERQVRTAVESFYASFNAHDFARAAEFTTEDWEHISPFGVWFRGREAVLKDLREVHGTFLKGVTDTPENVSVRLVTPDAAAVTVISRVGTFTTPDGTRHENERWIRTFVVVRRAGRWLIMQDQNTVIAP
jgi:uncharacterized protein (TIGR02246 family)